MSNDKTPKQDTGRDRQSQVGSHQGQGSQIRPGENEDAQRNRDRDRVSQQAERDRERDTGRDKMEPGVSDDDRTTQRNPAQSDK